MTEKFTIERTGQRPLRFTGDLIAKASTSNNSAMGGFSGEPGIWHKAAVYALPASTYLENQPPRGYVLAFSRLTQWEGQRDEHFAWKVDTLEALATVIETELPGVIADDLIYELGIVEDLDRDLEG